MICILKFKPVDLQSARSASHVVPAEGSIAGWIIATDVHDARRQAQAAGESDLAGELYRREFLPIGKHQITLMHVALVS